MADSSKRTVHIIAPVLNEEENIPNLISSWNELQKQFKDSFKFYLVDDGSSDKTSQVAIDQAKKNQCDLKVLRHSRNLGPGAAFATGFSQIKNELKAEDIVVTMEGDNTSRITTLRIMLDRMDREGVNVALASPYAYGGGFQNTSFFRVFLSHSANGVTKIFLNIHGINTLSSFFRAYRGSVILNLQEKWGERILECSGFECMVELLKKIVLLHESITEVPMKLDSSLRKGKSKMKILRTIRGYFSVIWMARKWG